MEALAAQSKFTYFCFNMENLGVSGYDQGKMSIHPIASSVADLEFVGRCLLAMVLGGIIGLEREFKLKPAGIKTHMLICLGATALTFLSFQMSFNGDPSRIAAQIVSGIGFIGGGAILHSHKMVQGLTTAATLWAAASLGMLIGAGYVFASCAFTLICLVILVFSTQMSSTKLIRKNYSVSMEIADPDVLSEIDLIIGHTEISVDSKILSRKKRLHLDINYYATPLSQHVFMKRILTLRGVGQVLYV